MDEASVAWVYAAALRCAKALLRTYPTLDAEDAVQSAWAKAGAQLPALPSDADRARFLKRALRQVIIDDMRRAKRRPTAPLFEWHADPSRYEDAVLDGLVLTPYLLAAPSDPLLLAVVLMGLGYDQREAAARMGCKPATVGSRVFRWHQERESR